MLIDEHTARNAYSEKIQRAQVQKDSHQKEAHNANNVQGSGNPKRTLRAKFRGKGVKSLALVKFLILCAVHRIKGPDPERHRRA